MSDETNLNVVLGATGALGSAVVYELVRRNKPVVAISRDSEKAEKLFGELDVIIRKADVKNQDEVLQAVKGAKIIYHCIGIPYGKWLKDFPVILDNIIYVARNEGAQLVYADNLYMYGKMEGDKLAENHPLAATSKKGKLRIRLASQLLDTHNQGDIQVVIARFGDFFGPNVVNGFTKPLFENPLNGKPAAWIADLDQKHSLIYIEDAAKGLIQLAEDNQSYGQIWHIEGDAAITGSEFISMIYQELNQDYSAKSLDEKTVKFLSLFVPIVKELRELLDQWKYPFIIDGSKYNSKYPDYEVTPNRKAISETLKWFNLH